jgi:hypothetical protein
MIAGTDPLSNSWFKTKILGGLNCANIKFTDPSINNGGYTIVVMGLTTPTRFVVLANCFSRVAVSPSTMTSAISLY